MRIPPIRRRRDDSGVSSVELVLYMPLLMFIIFIAVQFSLVWFGNQAASAIAREAAREARVTGSRAAALHEGENVADNLKNGVLENHHITVDFVGDDRVRVTVTGEAQEISPIGVPIVSQTVEGPLEVFEDQQ